MFDRFGEQPHPHLYDQLPAYLRQDPNAETRIVTQKWGDMTIACSPMAPRVPKNQLLEEISQGIRAVDSDNYDDKMKLAAATLEASGIPTTHRSHPLSPDHTIDDVRKEAAAIAHVVFETALDKMGWKHEDVDHVMVTNLNLSEAFSAQVVAALGLDKETTSFESERVACAG
ncbi:hypothetical protein C4579_02485, partial [Candidatus Microgenomates bacterium]